jgi:hypothetical protein
LKHSATVKSSSFGRLGDASGSSTCDTSVRRRRLICPFHSISSHPSCLSACFRRSTKSLFEVQIEQSKQASRTNSITQNHDSPLDLPLSLFLAFFDTSFSLPRVSALPRDPICPLSDNFDATSPTAEIAQRRQSEL